VITSFHPKTVLFPPLGPIQQKNCSVLNWKQICAAFIVGWGLVKNNKGDPPGPIDPYPGCRFVQRCPFAKADSNCSSEMPGLRKLNEGHKVACHRFTDDGVSPQDQIFD
jgi:hypothetical protein